MDHVEKKESGNGKSENKTIKELVVESTIKEIFSRIGRQYGIIHTAPVIINGDKGFLIWDYILINELIFVNSENDKITSLYKSLSDKKMEDRFNEFVRNYGGKENE